MLYDQLKERIQKLAAQNKADALAIRRHLHAYPELSFQEFNTAKFIGKTLRDMGIEVQTGIAKTGLVAVVSGENPDKCTLILRADIDALPIQEQNDVAYQSQIKGVMHACGHDVHTTSLIMAAKLLDASKEEFEGTIKLIFQPAEEKAPGGAISMIQAGVLNNPVPVSMIGQHVSPCIPVGQIGLKEGTFTANTYELSLTVQGKGGHAALPQGTIDPVLIAAHIIVALQQIISRNNDPIVPSLLSICQIKGGEAMNAIPSEVYLAGTFRTIDASWGEAACQKMTNLAQGMAQAMGGSCIVDIRKGYPSIYNDPALTQRIAAAAEEYLGNENVIYLDVEMIGEDFAYYAQQVPGCFYYIGTKNSAIGTDSPLHTPTFNVDEDVLELGPGLMAWLALKELAAH